MVAKKKVAKKQVRFHPAMAQQQADIEKEIKRRKEKEEKEK